MLEKIKDKISAAWTFPCCTCALVIILLIIGVAALASIFPHSGGELSSLEGGSGTCLEYPQNANSLEVKTCLENWINSNTSSRSVFRKSEGGNSFAQMLTTSGKQYNINPALMLAIGMHESAGGTSLFNKNNYFGWGAKDFGSLKEATQTQASGLKDGYIGQGLDTIEKIQPKYCPLSDPPCKDWVPGVSHFFNSIITSCPQLQCSTQLATIEGCLNVPQINQREDYWCGRASQQMVIAYHKPEYANNASFQSRHPLSGADTINRLTGERYKESHAGGNTLLDEINTSLNKGYPVIYYGGDKFSRGWIHHIFVLTGYNNVNNRYCANNTYRNLKNVFQVNNVSLTAENLKLHSGPQANSLIYHP